MFMYTHIYSVLGETLPPSAGTDIQTLHSDCGLPALRDSLFVYAAVS